MNFASDAEDKLIERIKMKIKFTDMNDHVDNNTVIKNKQRK